MSFGTNHEYLPFFDETIRLDAYKTIHIFKRKGEDWTCSECDMAPNGGSGSISLQEALSYVDDINLQKEIEKYNYENN